MPNVNGIVILVSDPPESVNVENGGVVTFQLDTPGPAIVTFQGVDHQLATASPSFTTDPLFTTDSQAWDFPFEILDWSAAPSTGAATSGSTGDSSSAAAGDDGRGGKRGTIRVMPQS